VVHGGVLAKEGSSRRYQRGAPYNLEGNSPFSPRKRPPIPVQYGKVLHEALVLRILEPPRSHADANVHLLQARKCVFT